MGFRGPIRCETPSEPGVLLIISQYQFERMCYLIDEKHLDEEDIEMLLNWLETNRDLYPWMQWLRHRPARSEPFWWDKPVYPT